MTTCSYVFGYGSLVDPLSYSRTLGRKDWRIEDFPLVKLSGYRRIWNVAMDNSKPLPGYKQYFIRNTDTAPKVFVTFVNIEPFEKGEVLGTIVKVNQDELEKLVKREQNYKLVDVTQHIVGKPAGNVYAFVGIEQAMERFCLGKQSNQAIICRSYLQIVENAHRLRGTPIWENYQSTDDQKRLIVLDLERKPVADY